MSETPPFPIFKLKLKLSKPPSVELAALNFPAPAASLPQKSREKIKNRSLKIPKCSLSPLPNSKSIQTKKNLSLVSIKNVFGYDMQCFSYGTHNGLSFSTFVCHITNCHKIFNSRAEWQGHIVNHN